MLIAEIRLHKNQLSYTFKLKGASLSYDFIDFGSKKYCLRENSELKLNFVKRNSPKTGCNPLKYVDSVTKKAFLVLIFFG